MSACRLLHFLCALLLVVSATRGEELLRHAIVAMGARALPAGKAHYLRAGTVEPLHEGVDLPLEIEIWWTADAYLEVQQYRGWMVHAKLWDGERLYFAEDGRLRHPLGVDRSTFAHRREVMQLAALLPILDARSGFRIRGTTADPTTLVVDSSTTDTLYELRFDPDSHLLVSIEYTSHSLYGGTVFTQRQGFHFEDYKIDDTGVPIARTIRHAEESLEKMTAYVVSSEMVDAPGFTPEALRQRMGQVKPFPRELSERSQLLLIATHQAIARGAAEWSQHRFSKVITLLDADRYKAGLLERPAYIMVAPDRLEAHSSAHFMPMDLDEDGLPRLDVITLRDAPMERTTDFLTLMHEASHLLIRQHQAKEPILAVDDEDLVAWQEECVHLLGSLSSFEQIAFARPRPANYVAECRRLWGHVVLRYRYGMAEHALRPAELDQFEAITGFRLRLDEVRAHYLELGLDESVMPMVPIERFQRVLDAMAERQKEIRVRWAPYLGAPPVPETK